LFCPAFKPFLSLHSPPRTGLVPFIIGPIDHGVDMLLDNTTRYQLLCPRCICRRPFI
jgi:hypothetical protein